MGKDDAPVIDMSIINSILDMERQGLKGFFAKQVALFCDFAPEYVKLIERSIEAGNPADLIHAAHKFNGSASSLGAREIGRICIELEKLGYSGQLDPCRTLIVELESCFRKTRLAFEEIVQHQIESVDITR